MICPENGKHAEFHRPASIHIFYSAFKNMHMLARLCSTILCNTPTKWPALAEAKKNPKKQQHQPTSVTSHSAAAARLCENFCAHARMRL